MRYYQLFATPNAFRRQVNMGVLQLLKVATEQRHVQVRILIPGDKQIKDTIGQAAKVCPLVDFRVAEEYKKLFPEIHEQCFIQKPITIKNLANTRAFSKIN
jgi:hypothetical protein